MIVKIKGLIVEQGENYLHIDVAGLTYEVFLSAMTLQRLNENIDSDGKVSLVTFHYQQIEPSRGFPVLIGFLNKIEKDFFESFITVSGIGPKAALRALNKPISSIAQAIDNGDTNFLRSLPGIGPQRAKEIVAKLQNKVGKFGLIKDSQVKELKITEDFEEESLAVLMQLGYKNQEAVSMMKKALENNKGIKSTEELLNEVYKQRKTQ